MEVFLERYDVSDETTVGGSLVHLARDLRTDAVVAIKEYSVDDPYFQNDVSRYATLFHPFLACVYETLEVDKCAYAVFEWGENGSLLDLVQWFGPISEVTARRFILQLLAALSFLHYGHNLVLGCLRSEIVRLDSHQTIKIAPGIAGGACAAYAAPEVVLEQPVTAAADIWSLGVLLYELVTGRLPFETAQMGRLVQKILRDDPEFPVSISPELSDLLFRMLAKDPAQRITIENIQQHPWLLGDPVKIRLRNIERIRAIRDPAQAAALDPDVVQRIVLCGIDTANLARDLATNNTSEATVAYNQLIREQMAEQIADAVRHTFDRCGTERINAGASLPAFTSSSLVMWAKPRMVASLGAKIGIPAAQTQPIRRKHDPDAVRARAGAIRPRWANGTVAFFPVAKA
jgi:hypothetical protein